MVMKRHEMVMNGHVHNSHFNIQNYGTIEMSFIAAPLPIKITQGHIWQCCFDSPYTISCWCLIAMCLLYKVEAFKIGVTLNFIVQGHQKQLNSPWMVF